jgi:DNA polymerase-3 subunit delta'
MVSAAAKSPPRARVIGQEEVRRQLAESLRGGRAAHAYLFSGSDGIGKTAVALEFAQLLLCDRNGLVPCGECEQCQISSVLQHPDLKLIVPVPPKTKVETGKRVVNTDDQEAPGDAAAIRSRLADAEAEESVDVDQLFGRHLLKVLTSLARDRYADTRIDGANIIRKESILGLVRTAWRKPFQAKRKVFVILHAELINPQIVDRLLKTLEEPAPETYFLLVSDNEGKIPLTIRSRCQRVRMTPLPVETIYNALIAEGIPGPRAELAARLSGGSFDHAVDLSSPNVEKVQENVIDFLRAVSRCNPLYLQDAAEKLMDTESLPDFTGLEMLGLFLRDTAMLRLSAGQASQSRLAFGNLEDKVQAVISAYPQANFEEAVRAVDESVVYLTKGYTKDLILHALAIRLNRALGTLVRTKRTVASTHE